MITCAECNQEIPDEEYEFHHVMHLMQNAARGQGDALWQVASQMFIANILTIMRMDKCSTKDACFKLWGIWEIHNEAHKIYLDRGLPK